MFRSNEETEQLLFIVEQYIGKPLSATEVRTILFIYDKLGFSADLIDYLVQYCVGKEKKFPLHRKSSRGMGGKPYYHSPSGKGICLQIR